PQARHRGVAQELFRQMKADCERSGINQYYLIRATNPEADRFYRAFEGAELTETPLLRRYLKD
nr:GNAT family N-acetyltransferase [Lachnospiraceae bacterium]